MYVSLNCRGVSRRRSGRVWIANVRMIGKRGPYLASLGPKPGQRPSVLEATPGPNAILVDAGADRCGHPRSSRASATAAT